jgi:lysophospholipase L1-like esterase
VTAARATLFSVLAAILGFMLAGAAGEIVLRTFWPQRSAVTLGMFATNPDAGYALLPDYRNTVRVPEYATEIRIDGHGERVPENEPPENPGASRLLALGDSFTFGVGVEAEDAFPEILEDRLQADSKGPWVVRNGGVGGYGPLRSARLFLASQASWEPNVVIHALYLGNDLEDQDPARFRDHPRIENGRMVTEHGGVQRLRLALRSHSHLYLFLRQRLYGLYQKTYLARRAQYLDPVGLAEWPASIRETSWPAGRAAIREIAEWCRARERGYLVLLVPTRYQVEEGAWHRYRREWGLPEEAFDREHGQREVRAFLEAESIPHVDFLEAFRAAAEGGKKLYYSFDQHWTRDGHELAAEIVHARLRDLGWLASAGPSPRGRATAAPSPRDSLP